MPWYERVSSTALRSFHYHPRFIFCFPQSKVKRIAVNEQTQQGLIKGLFAICVLNDEFYLINKEDRGGAEEVAREVERSLALSAKDPNWKPPVLIGSMENESGASDVLDAIQSHLNYRRSKN